MIENLKFLKHVSLSFLHLTFLPPHQCFSPIGTLKRSGFGTPSSTERSREPSAGSGACVTVAPRMTTATPPERPPGLADGSPVLFFPSAAPSSQSPRLKNWGLFSSLFSFPTPLHFAFEPFLKLALQLFPASIKTYYQHSWPFPCIIVKAFMLKETSLGWRLKGTFILLTIHLYSPWNLLLAWTAFAIRKENFL